MSVLKVVKEGEEVIEKKGGVVAGQVRMDEEGRDIVLVIYTPLGLSERQQHNGEEYSTVKINATSDWEYRLNAEYSVEHTQSIMKDFPIVLDATLTYKEA